MITDVNPTTGALDYTTQQTASNAKRSSAEWIVEAPSSSSGILPLANFGSVTFTSAVRHDCQREQFFDLSTTGLSLEPDR